MRSGTTDSSLPVKERPPVRGLRVALVCMPWASLDMPSLAVSTLAAVGGTLDCVDRIDVVYANMRWADYVHAHTGGRVGSADYRRIVDGYYVATGEWVFSAALYGWRDPTSTPFFEAASRARADLTAAAEMYRLAPGFVDELAAELVSADYDVIGFTSTFDQDMPSLAVATRLKALRPRTRTVMGGANCDDRQGEALHRNFPVLDYVVRGEGELTFPALLSVLHKGDRLTPDQRETALAGIGGLCWRDARGRGVVNRQAAQFVPFERIPEADITSYFNQFRNSTSVGDVEPKIQLEGSRGCWWGEKHHCTFCGLNGSLMRFRAKSAERVLTEIEHAVRLNRCLDVVFSDNIMDVKYIRELMPRLVELDWDLRVFFEVKSNLSFAHLRALSAAGITQLQPGIESLSTNVLRLMRKGVKGWQNVRLLRDCRTLAIHPGWNILYGFPGETDQDYTPMIEQLPNLVHLQPPEGCYRLVLARFSPFFNDPSLGLRNRGPSGLLAKVYRLPTAELADMGYIFESDEAGIRGALVEEMVAAHEHWHAHHRGRRLVAVEADDHIRVVDARTGDGETVTHLLDPAERALFRLTLRGRTAGALAAELQDAGWRWTLDRVSRTLACWRERGWLYRDGDHLVCLATGLSYER